MPRCWRSLAVVVLVWSVTGLAEAQQRMLPPAQPIPGRSVSRSRFVVTGGVGRGYFVGPFAGPHAGPYGWGDPYGIVEPRVTFHIIAPVRPRLLAPPLDLSGIDLDVEVPPWAHEFERPKHDVPPPRQPDEVAKRIEPPPKAPAPKPLAPDPMAPRADPVEEGQRLATLGVVAFRGQEYGLAARKFKQALEIDPTASRAYFYLSQAYFALGQYRDAVQMIGLGLGLDRGWPQRPFRPRFDLYGELPEDWLRHLQLLEDAQARQPNNSGYVFLLAHQRWFDDQRDDALKLFRQVRPLVGDPALVDLFLKAAP
ncbi:MAG: tetratricopeptide repeat protein [Gemmataceae bacterium]|nr:tetratricopeptide repeat protein [Gemmataceae bacterium]